MNNSQQGLGSYGVNVENNPGSQVRQDPHTIGILGSADDYATHSMNREVLPDIEGFDWEVQPVQQGPVKILEYWRLDGKFHDDLSHEEIPGSGGIIIHGADDYLRDHALSEINVPEYYTSFDEMDTHYRWSADGRTHISWRFLKRAVRLSNGYGRIDPVTTRVVLCDTGHLFVSGPRGAFLVDIPPGRIFRNGDDLPEPPDSVYETIRGIQVPEENPELQTAFERYIGLLSESPYPSPISHAGFNGADHVLETTSGTTVVNENSLKIVGGQAESFEITVGVYSRQCEGTNFVVSVDPMHLPGKIGEEVTLADDITSFGSTGDTTGIITGYRTEWREDDHIAPSSSGVSTLRFNLIVGLITPDLTVTRRRINVAAFEPRK
ncbi:hypothetical protein [Haloarcula sp. 1CSR25-25]|jgi:hypothetical protein|uniref:hypothetical protein n=1 Tax=Haloarcula sp. 1CSR25-25 TaxID=2862545 RepID=UPI00289388C8|nr:hypothetical protein [Haloarcula sp. 1CSR25-25]MDT3437865.1 hypothetical protein [Haloarcula sp. 1CSR25-25]